MSHRAGTSVFNRKSGKGGGRGTLAWEEGTWGKVESFEVETGGVHWMASLRDLQKTIPNQGNHGHLNAEREEGRLIFSKMRGEELRW